jgi:hypothetical protein
VIRPDTRSAVESQDMLVMTQDRYLGRKLTDRQTAEVLEKLLGSEDA